MNEKTITAKILLDNYYNGNKWLSTEDVNKGYEMEQDGVKHVYFVAISRRVSDIKVKGLYIEKLKNFNHTPYTAYRLSNSVTKNTLDELAKYSGYKNKDSFIDKFFNKLFN